VKKKKEMKMTMMMMGDGNGESDGDEEEDGDDDDEIVDVDRMESGSSADEREGKLGAETCDVAISQTCVLPPLVRLSK
jgi:hypothetical protein